MSQADCIFCKIAAGEIPADVVYEGEGVLAFRDVNPQAPTHILVIPRKHIASVGELGPEDEELVGRVFLALKEVAAQEGLESHRIVTNTGADAGQSVLHLHLHLLGGRSFHWPPG